MTRNPSHPSLRGAQAPVAVGTLIAERPPHRSVRAAFPHTAPTSGQRRLLAVCSPAQVARLSGSVPGACIAVVHSPWSQPLAPPTPQRYRLVRRLHRYYDWARLPASVHHRLRLLAFPMRTIGLIGRWSDAGPPRFRRVPFVRDGVFDHGRASAPRIAAPHMLPSTLLTGSASANFCLSRLNNPPRTIVVYASRPPLPATTQHSLPGGRYPLPGPDLHRQDRANFPGAQAIQNGNARLDCFVADAPRNDGIRCPPVHSFPPARDPNRSLMRFINPSRTSR